MNSNQLINRKSTLTLIISWLSCRNKRVLLVMACFCMFYIRKLANAFCRRRNNVLSNSAVHFHSQETSWQIISSNESKCSFNWNILRDSLSKSWRIIWKVRNSSGAKCTRYNRWHSVNKQHFCQIWGWKVSDWLENSWEQKGSSLGWSEPPRLRSSMG